MQPDIKTFTYDLIDSKMYVIPLNHCAIVIDPNISEEAAELLSTRHISDVRILLTHEHFDHISGLEWFKERFNCTVYCSEACDHGLKSPVLNLSKHFSILFMDKEEWKREQAEKIIPVTYAADVIFRKKIELMWEGHQFFLIETPGHSMGSICIMLDGKYLFTGDSLMKNIPVTTCLPGGSRREYKEVTWPFFKSLGKDLYVFPGHGDSFWLNTVEGLV